MADIVKQKKNKEPVAGFNVHPENINRAGRPPSGQALTDIMREVLEEKLPDGKSRKEALVRKVLNLAYDGNEAMVRLAWSYLEGNPRQALDMTLSELPKPILGGTSVHPDNSNEEDKSTDKKN